MKKSVTILLLLLVVFSQGLQARGFRTFSRYEKTVSDTIARAGLPSDLAYLPLVITGCNPDFSDSFCAGAWAVSGSIARHYGLVVGSAYDSRLDMEKCTGAAVAYLKDLYAQFNGRMEDVIRQYFTSIQRYELASSPASVLEKLSQTREDYRDFRDSNDDPVMASVSLADAVMLREFSQAVDVPIPQLMRWNPAIRSTSGILPQGAVLNIPKDKVRAFSARENGLYASVREKEKEKQTPQERSIIGSSNNPADSLVAGTPGQHKPVATAKPKYTTYTVKKGDNLGSIARKFKTSVSKIVKDNHLKSADKIREGQTLKIYKSSK